MDGGEKCCSCQCSGEESQDVDRCPAVRSHCAEQTPPAGGGEWPRGVGVQDGQALGAEAGPSRGAEGVCVLPRIADRASFGLHVGSLESGASQEHTTYQSCCAPRRS